MAKLARRDGSQSDHMKDAMKHRNAIIGCLIFSWICYIGVILEPDNIVVMLVVLAGVLISLPLGIYCYLAMLRSYFAERRQAMQATYGSAECQAMAQLAEFEKVQERARHGFARQASAPSQLAPPPIPPPPPAAREISDSREALKVLQQMKDDGLITEAEFSEKKSEILKRL